jgi:hypothetical protein
MATIINSGKFEASDGDGVPYAGGELYTYLAGSAGATPKATYSDAKLTTPNANPVVLDADGRADVWVGGGSYLLILKDALGNTVWSVDDYLDEIGGVILFDTVALMKAESLAAGETAMTRGYYTKGDGGGATYLIVAPQAFDGYGDHELANGNIAVLQYSGAINVKWFGAKGDGVADDSANIQSAIDYAGANSRIDLPPGAYKTTATLIINALRVHFIGAGSWSTRIIFAPTADDTCLQLNTAGTVLYQGAVKGISFYSDDSTYTKIALDIMDTSGYSIDDITVGGGVAVSGSAFWSGGVGSIGIRTRGRELAQIKGLYVFADRPIVVADNPNSSIDIDHFHFEDCYLGANGNPNIEVETGINLTSVTFDGYQAWVLGTDGFKWVDTSSVGSSNGLTIDNVRTEQGTNAASYNINIQHNTVLQNLSIGGNCNFEGGRNGFYLRKCDDAVLSDSYYTGIAGKTSIDVDSTVARMKFRNMFWQAGSASSMAGQNVVKAGALVNGMYQNAEFSTLTKPSINSIFGGALSEEIITIANDGIAEIAPQSSMGMITIQDSEGLGAIYHLRGNYNVTSEVADPAGVFSPTQGIAASTNIYWDAGNTRYSIENKRGSERKYKVLMVGAYGTF